MEKPYTLKAGEAVCPWCDGVFKSDVEVEKFPITLQCECGGIWELIRPPQETKVKGKR